jgi:hypothetical protein
MNKRLSAPTHRPRHNLSLADREPARAGSWTTLLHSQRLPINRNAEKTYDSLAMMTPSLNLPILDSPWLGRLQGAIDLAVFVPEP